MATQDNLEKRLARLEAELKTLKTDDPALKEKRDKASKDIVKFSKKFLADPNRKSANVFLDELEKVSARVPTRLGWWTITVTILTILDDDQADSGDVDMDAHPD